MIRDKIITFIDQYGVFVYAVYMLIVVIAVS